MKSVFSFWSKSPSLPKTQPLVEENDYLRCVSLKRICMTKVIEIYFAFKTIGITIEKKPELLEILHKLSYINVHNKVFDFLDKIAAILTDTHVAAQNFTSSEKLPQLPDIDKLVNEHISKILLKDSPYSAKAKSFFYYKDSEIESAIKYDPLAPIKIPEGKEINDLISQKLVAQRYFCDLISGASKAFGTKPSDEKLFLLEAVKFEKEIVALRPPSEPILLYPKLFSSDCDIKASEIAFLEGSDSNAGTCAREEKGSYEDRQLGEIIIQNSRETNIPDPDEYKKLSISMLQNICIYKLRNILDENDEAKCSNSHLIEFFEGLKSFQPKLTLETYNFFKMLLNDLDSITQQAYLTVGPPCDTHIFDDYIEMYLAANPKILKENIYEVEPII